jgi:hypothetical protein
MPGSLYPRLRAFALHPDMLFTVLVLTICPFAALTTTVPACAVATSTSFPKFESYQAAGSSL